MKMPRLTCFGALALAVSCVASLRADGLVRDGIGPISSGRGGTNIAFGDNGAILNDNPAGMANIQSNGLYEVAVDTVFTHLNYTDADPNSLHNASRPTPSPELAYFRKSADGRFTWGVGAYAVAGFCASYQMNQPLFGPQKEHYQSIGAFGRLLPGIAYQVNDRLSVGIAVGLGVCHVEFEGPFFLQTGALAGAPARLDFQGTGVAPTGTLGMQYKWDDATTVGLAYTEETNFNLDGVTRADLLPIGQSSRFDSSMHIVWPRSLGIGIKHNLCDCQRISCDVIWYDWSHAFDTIDISLRNSSNPIIPAIVGPTINDSLPTYWHDSVSMRLGYEWSPTDIDVLRCGYVYHKSPTPNSTLNPYLDGVLEHAFSVGWSRKVQRCVVNLAYQYSFSPTREVTQSDFVGGDFANSTFKAQAHWASIGFLVPF